MRVQSVLIGKVAIHSGNHTSTAPLRRCHHFTEQIAGAEEFAPMVVRHLCWIEGDNAAAVQKYSIDLKRCPIVGPRFCVECQRIALVEIDLSASPHHAVPGNVYLTAVAAWLEKIAGCSN